MCLYFIPIFTALLGWWFFALVCNLFLNKKVHSKWNLLHFLKKEKPRFAIAAGKYAKNQLSLEGLMKDKVEDPELFQAVRPQIESYVDIFLKEKLIQKWPVISLLGGDEVLMKIKESLMEEMAVIFPKILLSYSEKIMAHLPLGELVEKQIIALSEVQINDYILLKSKKIKIFLCLSGALFGLFMGIMAILLVEFSM